MTFAPLDAKHGFVISFWSEINVDWVWWIPPGIAVLIAGWVLFVRVEATGAKHVPLRLLRLGWACYGFAWGYLGAVSIQQGVVNDNLFLVVIGFLPTLAGVPLMFAGIFLSREEIIDQSKYLAMGLLELAEAERMKNAIPPSERVRMMHEEDDGWVYRYSQLSGADYSPSLHTSLPRG